MSEVQSHPRSSRAWKASSPSQPRSQSLTKRVARCATAASTSKTWLATIPYEQVWGLLVDGHFKPGLPPAEPHALTVRSGDHRVDVQSALAMLAPEWGFGQLIDITDEQARDDLARASVMALSFVAQSAREAGQPPVPQAEIDEGGTIPERFLIRWRGEANPDHVKAIDAYWVSAAEHGMNASTFTARVVASTGADCAAALSAAVGALSGPLHGGAPSRVLKMIDEVEASGDAERWVKDALDRGDRLMGFGHRVYRAEDPRARVLRRTSRNWDLRACEAAEALEKAALAELHARKPDRVLATNVEFWSAVVLDLAEVPPDLFTPMFTCARVAGWSAHILEQKREAKLIRPTREVRRARAAFGLRSRIALDNERGPGILAGPSACSIDFTADSFRRNLPKKGSLHHARSCRACRRRAYRRLPSPAPRRRSPRS